MGDSYRDLIVWQRSIQLSVAVYRLTHEFPRDEAYGLVTQLRRAGVSIASNIAEGYGRGSTGEYKHYLAVARGANFEVQTQLEIAKQLEFGGRREAGKRGWPVERSRQDAQRYIGQTLIPIP